ncbi:hypothetical protein VTK73DRAFT_9036 [Phialemonium thermophilum]|uniref:Uncharacterized protein n=1 Tax=Phialemonium thermophilum TaxID=223376 RepID=A0ABR3XML5_9PEZI
MRTTAASAAFAAFLGTSASIFVTDGSSCAIQCGNVADAITGADVVCDETQYGSQAGIVFENCIRCELGSNYTIGNRSDLQSLLYNIRFATSYCVFGDPGNPNIRDSPCVTSTACGPLKKAIEWNNLTTDGGAFDFCQNWIGTQVEKCDECLVAGNQHYFSNFVTMMDAACRQKPAPGNTISIAGDPFSTVPVNVTTPSPKPLYTFHKDNSPVGLGARVGIAIGGIVAILAFLGCCIVLNGKRRRRAFLRELEARHAAQGWPHPKTRHGGGGAAADSSGDMFETPVSQRPLRGGWGESSNSPVSAATETTDRSFPRYFSPYSSTFNSPVSAGESSAGAMMNWPALSPQRAADVVPTAPLSPGAAQKQQKQQQQQGAFAHWPSPTQEKLMQLQHEQELKWAAADAAAGSTIGVAIGGDEASLRSKDSNLELNSGDNRECAFQNQVGADSGLSGLSMGKAKQNQPEEVYEMHAVQGGRQDTAREHSSDSSLEDRRDRTHNQHECGYSSNNPYRMPVQPQAPVLNHPGYGRRPSLKRSGTTSTLGSIRYGGLTEEDARRGDAL